MNAMWKLGCLFMLGVLAIVLPSGCDNVSIPNLDDIIPDDITNGNDNGNGNGDETPSTIEIQDFATNTGGGGGLALRPSDGALFLVSAEGLYGPIEEGTDVSTLSPIGATNLADPDLFDLPPSQTVLAISDAGEFWVATPEAGTLGRVPVAGGNAEPFTGLLQGPDAANIFPHTLAFVPGGFDGPDIDPGDLLAGEDTTFSKLAAINVNDLTVVNVNNPGELNRVAHHLAFGPDGVLYGSLASSSLDVAGIQTIDEDGLPTALPGTLGVSAHTFVVLDSGDLVVDGSFRNADDDLFNGLFFWSKDDEEIVAGLALATLDTSGDDEMVIAPDGTIYLSLPRLGKIVTVIDIR